MLNHGRPGGGDPHLCKRGREARTRRQCLSERGVVVGDGLLAPEHDRNRANSEGNQYGLLDSRSLRQRISGYRPPASRRSRAPAGDKPANSINSLTQYPTWGIAFAMRAANLAELGLYEERIELFDRAFEDVKEAGGADRRTRSSNPRACVCLPMDLEVAQQVEGCTTRLGESCQEARGQRGAA